ncbi:MAG TPA: class F sortase [Candidatus Dormibacteraeota bacterium]|nr:class F sortase [Candidatus Dormibacteraeota bacterium]
MAVLGFLLAPALWVAVASSWALPGIKLSWPAVAAVASPITRASATPSPAPSATPDDLLRQALAIVAPAKPPVRLRIPTINVDASVEQVGVDSQGRVAAPSKTDNVGWYKLGTAPGDAGNAVIDGHLDWYDGPAVFARLGKMKVGDQITIFRGDGTQVQFIVDATSVMPYDASTDAMFTKSGPPSLTLITCAGTWDRQRGTYLQRLVVHSSQAP